MGALLQAIFNAMDLRTKGLEDEKKVPAFLKRMSENTPFIESVQRIAGDPDHWPMFVYWLQVSTMYAIRPDKGRRLRMLHPVIFADKMLAMEAARVGNLDI